MIIARSIFSLQTFLFRLPPILNANFSVTQLKHSKLLVDSPNIPQLFLKSQKQTMLNWWSEKPFIVTQKMVVPVFKFETAQYTGQALQLPQDIFNCPLRRDLLYRLYHYRINLNKFRTKKTRDRLMTVGSNKKMRNQKGSGRARMGDKRAPHLRKGGKAHGSKPKIYSFPLNGKIKLKALKTLLTAKLVQGKIKFIDSQNISQPKTKILSKILKQYSSDERTLYYIITSQSQNQNFSYAKNNIKTLKVDNSYSIDVLGFFKADKILFTLEGLSELLSNINKTQQILYNKKQFPEGQSQLQSQETKLEFPYEYKFKILAQYLELYKKLKQQQLSQSPSSTQSKS